MKKYKNNTQIKKFFLSFTFLLVFLNIFSSSVPQMNGPINDYAIILKESEKAELRAFLESVNNQTSVQVAVLTIPSLEGNNLETFSMEVVEKWKLGQKDIDNGVLLLIAFNEKKIRIEVGYGLEASLTDVKSGLIIRNIIAPAFQSGKYGEGIIEAAKTIVGIATDNTEIISSKIENNSSDSAGIGVFIVFLFFMILMAGGLGRRRSFFSFISPIFWLHMLLGGSKNSSSLTKNRFTSGFSSGTGFSSGFSSGSSFRGGGGSFGGGGASGGW
mgnify:CR=1 FL=1